MRKIIIIEVMILFLKKTVLLHNYHFFIEILFIYYNQKHNMKGPSYCKTGSLQILPIFFQPDVLYCLR